MDRNVWGASECAASGVALRKESVDRNDYAHPGCEMISSVALRKESVDRNIKSLTALQQLLLSLSARRAWIEIK